MKIYQQTEMSQKAQSVGPLGRKLSNPGAEVHRTDTLDFPGCRRYAPHCSWHGIHFYQWFQRYAPCMTKVTPEP